MGVWYQTFSDHRAENEVNGTIKLVLTRLEDPRLSLGLIAPGDYSNYAAEVELGRKAGAPTNRAKHEGWSPRAPQSAAKSLR